MNSIEENPLLLSPVYSSIFENLKSKELLPLRGVCTAWNDFIQEVLKERQDLELRVGRDENRLKMLQFLKENSHPFLPSSIEITMSSRLDQLMRICELIGRLECIKSVELRKDHNAKIVSPDLVLTILQHFSPSMESLEMWMHLWIDQSLQNFPGKQKLISLPKLKDINIAEGMDKHKNLIKSIFTAAPNLQKMSKCHSAKIIPILRDSSRLAQIQHLDISDATEEHLQILLGAENASLKSLAIRFFDFGSTLGEMVEKLLEKQKSTLTSFLFNGYGSVTLFKFPTLPNLTKLDLSNGFCDFRVRVDFSKDMPNLQKMAVKSVHLQGNTGICKSVWNLRLQFCDPGEKSNFENFGSVFPSLRKLRLENCPDDFLQVVWRSCKNLTELEIRLKTNEISSWDFLLFGITDEWKAEVDMTQPNWWVGVNPPQEEQSLANCKDLQILKIEFGGIGKNITDFSVYFGISKMKRLKMLQLLSANCQISSEAKNFLIKELPFLKSSDNFQRPWLVFQ